MQMNSVLNSMPSQSLLKEIDEAMTKAFDSTIEDKKASRTKARDAVFRIISLDFRKMPIEEASSILGVGSNQLKQFILSENIQFQDSCGYIRNRLGSKVSESDNPKVDPAFLGQHELMALTTLLRTKESMEITKIVREMSTYLLLKNLIGP